MQISRKAFLEAGNICLKLIHFKKISEGHFQEWFLGKT